MALYMSYPICIYIYMSIYICIHIYSPICMSYMYIAL